MSELAFRNKLAIAGGGTGMQNRIVGIAGRKGSGKSSLTREIVRRNTREFVFDTMGEYTWVPDQFNDLSEAHSYIFERGASGDFFIASFVPEGAEKESLDADFSEICTAVYESGNMTLVVEELPMLSQPNYNPPAFDRIIRLGRHRCINILYTAQRLSEIPRRVTGATDVFVLFSHTEPRDLDAIAERCGPETASLVASLGDHEFLVYDVASRAVVMVDKQWYDSVLLTQNQWTPAIGRNGRSALWSLDEDAD